MNLNRPGWLPIVVTLLTLTFLLLPILIIFPLAFSADNTVSFPPRGFSTQWMQRVLSDPEWLHSFGLSVGIALLSTLLAMALALFAALALVRYRFRGKSLVYALIVLPMIVPNIIVALTLFFFFTKLSLFDSVTRIVLGHAIIALPIATLILSSTLQGMDYRLEQAAMSLGASQFNVLRRITLPLAAPGMISAAIFSFLSSFDELLIALFMAEHGSQTLSVRIWNSVQFQLDPTIAAVSVLSISVTIITLAVTSVANRKKITR